MSYKHSKFNSTFRSTVLIAMRQLGVKYAGNSRRDENGTLLFYDPEGECYYGFYESGYCRRLVPSNTSISEVIDGMPVKSYQLNRTVETRWSKNSVKRILAKPDEQLGRVIRGIISWIKR